MTWAETGVEWRLALDHAAAALTTTTTRAVGGGRRPPLRERRRWWQRRRRCRSRPSEQHVSHGEELQAEARQRRGLRRRSVARLVHLKFHIKAAKHGHTCRVCCISSLKCHKNCQAVHTRALALLPKGKKAGILLWGFGGEVRGDGQGGDGRWSRSNYTDGNCCLFQNRVIQQGTINGKCLICTLSGWPSKN